MSKAKTLNKAELKRVLNYNDAHERYRERNRAMILFTHLCGMRHGQFILNFPVDKLVALPENFCFCIPILSLFIYL